MGVILNLILTRRKSVKFEFDYSSNLRTYYYQDHQVLRLN